MVSVCLPSDALLQHLPSYLGFSYLGHGVSLHGCSSKAQPLLLTFDEGYLLTAAIPDLQCGIAPLGSPVPAQPPLLGLLLLAAGPGLGHGLLLPAATPGLVLGVAPQGHCPWPLAQGAFSQLPLPSDAGCLLPAATGLGHGVAACIFTLGLMKGIPLYPWRRKWSSVVVQLVKNLPETQETQFDFWVGKIPWRREYSSILGLLWWLRW